MKIRIINTDPIFDYKHSCLVTKGKDVTKVSFPSDPFEWWVRQICTEHSTLRSIHFVITDTAPKSCVMQIIRATKGHPQPEVQSSRPDWTGQERSTNPYEHKLFQMEFTPESFLAMCRQRLCYKTEPLTRNMVKEWVEQMKSDSDPLIKAIGYCAEPQCMYRGGVCSELESCGKFKTYKYELILSKVK